jgi:hypothetical protein
MKKSSTQPIPLQERLHLPPMQVHEDRPHAILSMSQAERFMTCPASIALSRSITSIQTSSEAAKEGTLAHTISELLFRQALGKPVTLPQIPESYDPYIVEHCKKYAQEVLALDGDLHIEVDLDFKDLHPNLGGTSDLVNIRGAKKAQVLHVGDLKFGRVPVSATENTQLLGYAVGARRTFQVNPKAIELKIYQPRGKDSTWTCTAEYLDAFEERLVQAANLTDDMFAPIVMSDKGCFWCRAKPICPEYAKVAKAAAVKEFAGPAPKAKTTAKVKPENLLSSLQLAQQLLPWCDAVILQAKEALIANPKVLPGYDLKPGRLMQKWKALDAAQEFIAAAISSLSPGLAVKLQTQVFKAPTLETPADVAAVFEDAELFAVTEEDQQILVQLKQYIEKAIDKSNAAPSLIKVKAETPES